MLGAKLEDLKLKDKKFNHHGAKEAVFPFDKFPKVDPVLGPEMRSTGEVLGLSDDYALAYYKSQEAAGSFLPSEGAVLISLSDKVNLSEQAIEIGKELKKHLRLGNARASTVAALGLRCFPEARCNQGRQMLRAREVGLLAGLFPSPAFGTRRVQSAIRKAAIKSVQGECRTKMLAFLYDRTEATDAKRQLQGSVHHDPRRCLQHREGNRRRPQRPRRREEPPGVSRFY